MVRVSCREWLVMHMLISMRAGVTIPETETRIDFAFLL